MSRNLGGRKCPVCGLYITLDIAEEHAKGLTTRSDRYHPEGATGYDLHCPGPETRSLVDRRTVTGLAYQCWTPLWLWMQHWEADSRYFQASKSTWELAWSRSWNDEPRCYECRDSMDYCDECRP